MVSVTKQPTEAFFVGFDFVGLLKFAEILDGVESSVSAKNEAGDDTTATILEDGSAGVTGTILQARVTGGADGDVHLIKFVAKTNQGNIYEEDIRLSVVESGA